jgi:protoheme IX farnesyltransferase
MSVWRTFAALTRVNLCLVVAATALTGYTIARGTIDSPAIGTVAGVWLIAMAASVLNQLQERDIDSRMARTRERPIPSGRITPRQALLVAIVLGTGGLGLLYHQTTPLAAIIGLMTLVWYNAVYTPLKRKTRFALFAGALTGALPPIIGAAAAGGNPTGAVLFVALFMHLWQIPHFLLMIMKYGHEYRRAGFPVMLRDGNGPLHRRTMFAWIVATSASTIAFIICGLVSGTVLSGALLACSGLFSVYAGWRIVRADYNSAILSMYLFQGIVLALLITSALYKIP